MNINTEFINKNFPELKKCFSKSIKPEDLKTSYEYRVLALLRYLFPIQFNTMIKGETPDFQDLVNSVGIEVVSAVNEKDMKARRALSDFYEGKNKENQIKKIEATGYKYQSYGEYGDRISRFGTSEGEKRTFQSKVEKKVHKIKEYRSTTNTIGLAVFLPDNPTSTAEENFTRWALESFEKFEDVFDFVYIISPRFCICYDFKKKINEKYLFGKNEYSKLCFISRLTAENKLSLTDEEWL